jgi:hypothetical protein
MRCFLGVFFFFREFRIMNITIKYRPFENFGYQKLRDTYRRVPCGDHQYVRFLEGLGAPRQQALRFAKPIAMNLPKGKPIESLIPFMGYWVPFVIPQEYLQTKVWENRPWQIGYRP